MSDRDEDPKVELAPEGSTCVVHPERAALVTCPRCAEPACLSCWHGAVKRCHACLLEDPGLPTPWIAPNRSFLARLFGTLGDAIRPRASAAGFARGEWRKAISFALLTIVPLAALSGIVPFTRRLLFGDTWSIVPVDEPTTAELALDLLMAAGWGVGRVALELLILGFVYLFFVQLYRERPMSSEPGLQALLYRGWLLPFFGQFGVIASLVAWGLPGGGGTPTLHQGIAFGLMMMAPMLLLMAGLTAAARVATAPPFAAILIALGAATGPVYLDITVLESPAVEAAVEAAQISAPDAD